MISAYLAGFGLCAATAIAILLHRKPKFQRKKLTCCNVVKSKKAETIASEGKIKALVTGGSGALGRKIVHGLIADGHYQIYSLDLFIPDEKDRNDDVYSYIQADITDRDSLRVALKDIEVVFHTAGIVANFVGFCEQDFYEVIAMGTENVVAVCKELGVRRLIYTSSVAAMLSSDPAQVIENLDESDPCPIKPRFAYGGAKILAEKSVLGASDILTCVLRPCSMFDAEILKCYDAMYIGDGSARMHIIPTDTVARIHIMAEKRLQREGKQSVINGKAYIIALEDSFSCREIAEFMGLKQGRKAKSIPLWLFMLLAYCNEYVYRALGRVPVDRSLRVDHIEFVTKNHLFCSERGRKEIGWEDSRSWKDVVGELLEKVSESDKNK